MTNIAQPPQSEPAEPAQSAPHIIVLGVDTRPSDIPEVARPGTRIVRTDRWSYNERTIERLRQLHAGLLKTHSAGLVDPTGLLGIESSGIPPEDLAKRTITEGPPIGTKLTGGYRAPAKLHAAQPTRTHNG